jgi:hypothetical protein
MQGFLGEHRAEAASTPWKVICLSMVIEGQAWNRGREFAEQKEVNQEEADLRCKGVNLRCSHYTQKIC